MAQLVARLSGGQEAVSSSLATPTNKKALELLTILVLFIFIKLLKIEVRSTDRSTDYKIFCYCSRKKGALWQASTPKLKTEK